MSMLKVELGEIENSISPEQRLFLNVILQAIDDATMPDKKINRTRMKDRIYLARLRDEARDYFRRGRFMGHAELIDIDPEWLMRKLRERYPWANEPVGMRTAA